MKTSSDQRLPRPGLGLAGAHWKPTPVTALRSRQPDAEATLQVHWRGALHRMTAGITPGIRESGHGGTQHVRAGFRLGSPTYDLWRGTSSRDTLRDERKTPCGVNCR